MIIQKKQCIMVLATLLVCATGMIIAGCSSEDAATAIEWPDVITISSMKIYGSLDRAPVQFMHDKHTEVLVKQGDSCRTCHLIETSGRMSQQFKRLEDTDQATTMEIYHEGCISCHLERKKTGPVTCGGCHQRTAEYTSSWVAIGFDRSLHHRHTKANQKECERCHHSYDETQQKLVYIKGQEASCRDCHQQEPIDDHLSLRAAAHYQCIECHRTTENAGPTDCAGCHDAQKQADIQVIEEPDRLFRNQPDFALLSAPVQDIENSKMKTVPFPHLEHEDALPSCRTCHHKTLQACVKCHTLTGGELGGGIKLERAMHDMNSEHSCVGCHEQEKSATECAGCHALMEQGRITEQSCTICHTGPEPDRLEKDRSRFSSIDNFRQNKANTRLSFKDSDIPDTVRISSLANKYQQAVFPHRKVIDRLRANIKDSPMATYFHGHEDVLCQGCHHHSPVGTKPPFCESCHGNPSDENNLFRPGLQGAFHQQCLGCHQQMKIDKPSDCVGCHAEKQ